MSGKAISIKPKIIDTAHFLYEETFSCLTINIDARKMKMKNTISATCAKNPKCNHNRYKNIA